MSFGLSMTCRNSRAASAARYYKRAMAGTNLVLIEPDAGESHSPIPTRVNRALRLLVDAAKCSATTLKNKKF